MTVDEAIEQACRDVGIMTPKRVSVGRWMKTDTFSGKNGKGDGRVIVHANSVTARNWQTSETSTVSLRHGLSVKERRAIDADMAKAKEKARREAMRAAETAMSLIAAAKLDIHPYLVSKGFSDEMALIVGAAVIRRIAGYTDRRGAFIPADYLVPNGGRHAIVMPARRDGRVQTAQLIWEDGTKKFLFGGEMAGTSHRVATGVDTWLCEGLATGLSVRTALRGLRMKSSVLCCFSASNIVAVSKHMRGRIFVAADNDKPLPQYGGMGTGEYFARQTDLAYGLPPIVGTDFNDVHQQNSIFAVQQILTSVMARGRAT